MPHLIVLIKLGVVERPCRCEFSEERVTSCLVIRQRQVAIRVFITSPLFSDITQHRLVAMGVSGAPIGHIFERSYRAFTVRHGVHNICGTRPHFEMWYRYAG